jgi:hypothetical protein
MSAFCTGDFHFDFVVSAGLAAGLAASDVVEELAEDAEDSDLALCL